MSTQAIATRILEPGDFGIEIEFTPNTEDPARVYRAMTGLIEATQIMDTQLAAAYAARCHARSLSAVD